MSTPKRVPSVLNSYEQLALLKQPNPRAPTGLRNLCIISLMLKIGLRVSEIINLKSVDLDWEKGEACIRGSGAAKERTLWIDSPELTLLKRWRQVKPQESEFLFTTLEGSRLKDRYIREMVKRLARKAGIDKDVYPHLLRYTFAVEFMRETRDINLLQDALGHRDSTATQVYTKLLFNEYKDAYMSDNLLKRSGMPVKSDQQQRITVNENIFSRGGQINSPADQSESALCSDHACTSITAHRQAETGLKNIPGHKAETDPGEPGRREPAGEGVLEKGSGIRAGVNKPAGAEYLPGLQKTDMPEPSIMLDDEENAGQKKIRIPAIKCSSCNYILRIKADCPQCGVKFTEILEHWRRNI